MTLRSPRTIITTKSRGQTGKSKVQKILVGLTVYSGSSTVATKEDLSSTVGNTLGLIQAVWVQLSMRAQEMAVVNLFDGCRVIQPFLQPLHRDKLVRLTYRE